MLSNLFPFSSQITAKSMSSTFQLQHINAEYTCLSTFECRRSVNSTTVVGQCVDSRLVERTLWLFSQLTIVGNVCVLLIIITTELFYCNSYVCVNQHVQETESEAAKWNSAKFCDLRLCLSYCDVKVSFMKRDWIDVN